MGKVFIPIFILFLIFGASACSPKKKFLFSSDAGNFGVNRKVNETHPREPETVTTPEGALIDTVILTASAQAGAVQLPIRPVRKLYLAPSKTIEYYKTKEKPSNSLRVLKLPVPARLFKKSINKLTEEDGKTTHKLAKLSLALGLGSVLFLLLTAILPAMAGVFSSLMFLSAIGGIVTGQLALRAIKKNPDKYSGKGKARAGYIISLVVSAILVLFAIIGLLFLILFFGNFT